MTTHDKTTSLAWPGDRPPRRVLAIRFQALGDIVATLPYLQSLRRHMPNGRLDLLTRGDVCEIPRQLRLFDRVYELRGGRNRHLQQLHAIALLPALFLRRYEVVIDLQHNMVSRIVRRGLLPRSWSEFDRYAPEPHGERVRRAITSAWPVTIDIDTNFERLDPNLGWHLAGLDGDPPEIVVLNPAGYMPSRHWPVERYVDFARLWLEERNPAARFLLLGLPRMSERAASIERALQDKVHNLVGRTSAAEAFSIVARASLVLSEDSGLMHMAWANGVPTVGLLGSSRGDWSRPLGKYSAWLDSSDLHCGECMQWDCEFGDVRCLARYSARQVFGLAMSVLSR